MTGTSYLSIVSHPPASDSLLSDHEVAVLRVLVESTGRVVGRLEVARRAGIADLGERRTDSLLVGIRRVLGSGAIRTVRGRGWILEQDASVRARKLLPD